MISKPECPYSSIIDEIMTPKVKDSKTICEDCYGTGACCSSCGEADEFCYCDQEERDIRRCPECHGTGNLKS